MVLDVNDLCHILHLMSNSLTSVISQVDTASSWSKTTDAWWKVLILRCLTMSFNGVQIKLILIWGTTNTSLIYLMRHCLLLIRRILFLRNTVHRVIDHVCRITKLVVLSSTIINIHWMWLRSSNLIITRRSLNLYIIPTSLWSPFNLILNLLGLLFVRFTNGNALTNLLLLGSVQRMHLLMRIHHNATMFIWRLSVLWLLHLGRCVHIDVRIVNPTIARIPFRRAWSISTLGSRIALRLPLFLSAWWKRSTRGHLLLLHHLTFDLLLVKLLRWCQIKVVDYVGNISYAIITLSLVRRIDLLASRWQIRLILRDICLILTLEPILHHFPLLILIALWLETIGRHDASTLESFVTYTFLTILAFTPFLIQDRCILIFELDFIFLLLLDMFSSKMLFSLVTLKLVSCKPWIYQWFLNVNRAHLLLAQFAITTRRLMRRWSLWSNRTRLLFTISALTRLLFLFVRWHFFVRTSSGLFLNFIRLTPWFLIELPFIVSTFTSFLVLISFILVFELLLLLLLLLKSLLELQLLLSFSVPFDSILLLNQSVTNLLC